MSVTTYCEYTCDMCGLVEKVPTDSIPTNIKTCSGVRLGITNGSGYVVPSRTEAHPPSRNLDLCRACEGYFLALIEGGVSPAFREKEKE